MANLKADQAQSKPLAENLFTFPSCCLNDPGGRPVVRFQGLQLAAWPTELGDEPRPNKMGGIFRFIWRPVPSFAFALFISQPLPPTNQTARPLYRPRESMARIRRLRLPADRPG